MPLPRPQILFFDVNETLLDLEPVKEAVNGVLLDESGASLWFSTLLQYSLVMTVNERYDEFSTVGAAVLQMLARNRDVALSMQEAKDVLAIMRTLPPHADVMPALRRLKTAGYRLVALTNSSIQGVEAQLEHARLSSLFEARLSVESVRRFKPHRAVYAWAAESMHAAPDSCMLVAAHGWDVAGAAWAGWQTAFIARTGQQKFPLADPPTVDVSDLTGLADALGA